MLQLTIKYMNMFSYSITTLFIPSNKDYHSYHNLHSIYQMCPNSGHLLKFFRELVCVFVVQLRTTDIFFFDIFQIIELTIFILFFHEFP